MASHKYMRSPPNLTGMPPGVPYIIGNEAAERFSYYGMKSVLTVFMAHFILNQSGLLAPMQENEAYMYTHYFVFGVYFLPILGAILADGWLGQILDDSCRFRSFTAWATSRSRAWPRHGESPSVNAPC